VQSWEKEGLVLDKFWDIARGGFIMFKLNSVCKRL
jgi:hypothetical protein